MRGINGVIKRLIKLLTMKYYYHCFINKPKVPIPQKYHSKMKKKKIEVISDVRDIGKGYRRDQTDRENRIWRGEEIEPD